SCCSKSSSKRESSTPSSIGAIPLSTSRKLSVTSKADTTKETSSSRRNDGPLAPDDLDYQAIAKRDRALTASPMESCRTTQMPVRFQGHSRVVQTRLDSSARDNSHVYPRPFSS